jgi:adenosine deaminase
LNGNDKTSVFLSPIFFHEKRLEVAQIISDDKAIMNANQSLGLVHQQIHEYEIARTELDLCDEDIAQIASYSFVYSYASKDVKQRGLLAVRDWLATASTGKDDDDDATNNK